MDRDWMRTTQSIERVSGQRQEREFSMQRQGDKIDLFRTHSPAETAQTKKPATHVFDISAGLRVSLTHHNYRVWVVETEGIELAAPHPVIEPVSDARVRNGILDAETTRQNRLIRRISAVGNRRDTLK
jgi:hypothetical protein